MAESTKATDSARQSAEEKGIDLSSVKGSGSGGQVTKSDVEQASAPEAESATAEEAPEKLFYVKVNPALGQYQSKVVVGDQEFLPGDEVATNIVSQSEYEELKKAKDPEHGIQLLLKGKEA